MAINWKLTLRILQAVFAVLVLGSAAYVSSAFAVGSPSQVNFLIFNSIFTGLVLVYIMVVPWRLPKYYNKFANIGLEGAMVLFWFAGFIALAVSLGGGFCGHSICGASSAASAFGAFEWLCWTATFTFAVLELKRGAAGGKAGNVAAAPEMQASQGV